MKTGNIKIKNESVMEGLVNIKNTFHFGNAPQVITGPGVVNLTSTVTHLHTTGGDAYSLADGFEGQEKYLVMITDGGNGTLTPDNIAIYSSFTFDDVGDGLHLFFTNGLWHFMGGTANRDA